MARQEEVEVLRAEDQQEGHQPEHLVHDFTALIDEMCLTSSRRHGELSSVEIGQTHITFVKPRDNEFYLERFQTTHGINITSRGNPDMFFGVKDGRIVRQASIQPRPHYITPFAATAQRELEELELVALMDFLQSPLTRQDLMGRFMGLTEEEEVKLTTQLKEMKKGKDELAEQLHRLSQQNRRTARGLGRRR